MSAVDDVIARLQAEIPVLGGRVDKAAALAALVARREMPRRVPASYVVWLGDDAGPVATATGVHRQEVTETIGVLLITRHAADPTGGEQLDDIEPLVDAAKMSLTGWQPPGADGALAYRRGRLTGPVGSGYLVAQLDFSAPSQLRVAA